MDLLTGSLAAGVMGHRVSALRESLFDQSLPIALVAGLDLSGRPDGRSGTG